MEDDQIRGNYVRFRAVVESDEEGIKIQNVLKTMGAKGVVCNFIPQGIDDGRHCPVLRRPAK